MGLADALEVGEGQRSPLPCAEAGQWEDPSGGFSWG
jgi:hypothetical protein